MRGYLSRPIIGGSRLRRIGEPLRFNPIDVVIPDSVAKGNLRPPAMPPENVALVLVYTDDAGRRWRKYLPGERLTELQSGIPDLPSPDITAGGGP